MGIGERERRQVIGMRIETNRQLGERQHRIMRVSMIGIGANLLLAGVKVALGLLSGSLAIISDALNNLTDSVSSIITMVGTRMASRRPTKDHPFGYGRIEYITSVMIGIILLCTGAQILMTSVKGILHPQEVHYTIVVNTAIAATILVKILLSRFTIRAGKELDSGALRASGVDARNDVLVSSVTLISGFLYMLTGFSLDAWAGAFISVFILKSGIDVFIDMHGHFLGQKADREISETIYDDVRACPIVLGAHDLILHDYGPDRMTGSVNIEVDSSLSTGDFFPVLYDLQMHLFQEHLTYVVFGIHAVDPQDAGYQKAHEILAQIAEEETHMMEYHGIYVKHESKSLYCDIVLDFSCREPYTVVERVQERLRKAFGGYHIFVNVDNLFA